MPENTETKTAVVVKRRIPGMLGDAALYRLSPPLDGHEFVVASAVVVAFSGPETYLFPADESGEVTSWLELPGSFQGGLDHAEALQGAGYEVQP